MDKLKNILEKLPKEIVSIIEAMQAKTAILENDKLLLQQENAILLRNQEMLIRAQKELSEENAVLAKQKPKKGRKP